MSQEGVASGRERHAGKRATVAFVGTGLRKPLQVPGGSWSSAVGRNGQRRAMGKRHLVVDCTGTSDPLASGKVHKRELAGSLGP